VYKVAYSSNEKRSSLCHWQQKNSQNSRTVTA